MTTLTNRFCSARNPKLSGVVKFLFVCGWRTAKKQYTPMYICTLICIDIYWFILRRQYYLRRIYCLSQNLLTTLRSVAPWIQLFLELCSTGGFCELPSEQLSWLLIEESISTIVKRRNHQILWYSSPGIHRLVPIAHFWQNESQTLFGNM